MNRNSQALEKKRKEKETNKQRHQKFATHNIPEQ